MPGRFGRQAGVGVDGGNPGVHCVGATLAEWMELEKIKAVGVEGGSSRCTGLELPHQDR